MDISKGDKVLVDFTYSVKWTSTEIPFENRMDKYAKYSFLPQHLEVGGRFLVSGGGWGRTCESTGAGHVKAQGQDM